MIGYDDHPFTGRVVRVCVRKLGITQDGYVIGRVRRTIDVGRPDPIAPVDPDTAIADEPWEPTRPTADETNDRIERKIVAHLTRFGPLRAKEIAAAIDEKYAPICRNLSDGEGSLYCRVGYVGKAPIWGLIEVDGK